MAGNARISADLVGKWRCTWLLEKDQGDYGKQQFENLAKTSKVWGEKISGDGVNNEYGDYKFAGRISRSSLMPLHYERAEQKQFLGGVIVMKLSPTRNKMWDGRYEYGRKRKIVGGTTVWQKLSR